MSDAVLKWGGVGPGPDKGGEIDLIVLCVDLLLGPWMAQPGPWTARPVKKSGLQKSCLLHGTRFCIRGGAEEMPAGPQPVNIARVACLTTSMAVADKQ